MHLVKLLSSSLNQTDTTRNSSATDTLSTPASPNQNSQLLAAAAATATDEVTNPTSQPDSPAIAIIHKLNKRLYSLLVCGSS